ncbi:IL23A protein, partial [Vireo altiloquus]|nr:IL23A protein [Vireo altiloquus]
MAPLLRLCLCLALLLLPSAAPAPTPAPAPGRRPDWAACRILSRELSRLLATAKEPHSALGRGSRCEPPRPSPQRCLQRIRQALQHYRDLLRSELFREQPQPQLETTMEQLLRHVQVRGLPKTFGVWARPFQRHLALKRLRSFAALISRVFNHSAR